MSKVKVSELWAEVLKVAQEQPEHVYERGEVGKCNYERNGQPSCIVGHAMHRLGVSVLDLREFDASGDSAVEDIIGTNQDLFDKDDELGMELLIQAQDSQDRGVPWGQSVSQNQEEPAN